MTKPPIAIVWLLAVACRSDASNGPPTASAAASAGAPEPIGSAGRPVESADTCILACRKDASDRVESYCGNDGKTYEACAWICDQVPKGVGVYPGKCSDDGKPPSKRPPAVADGKLICDWFDNNGEWIAVECEESTADNDPRTDFGGVGVAGATELRAAQTILPDTVSHRSRFGSVKDQGASPACVSFAGAAALEGAVTRETNSRIVLSEMHYLAHFRTTNYKDAILALSTGAALTEAANEAGLPYDADLANAWLGGEAEPSTEQVKALDEKVAYTVATVRELVPAPGAPRVTAEQMAYAIANGDDLLVGFRMSDNWYSSNLKAGAVVEDYDNGRNFGHSVLLIGYKVFMNRRYFEVRNSWGTAWGNGGYGFVSFETAEANLQTAASVTVRRRDDIAVQDCATGEAAGFDGKCRKVCPDGALEADDGCQGVGSDCPAGRVKDASDVCVRACSTSRQQIAGLTVDCKDQGCVWTIPGGTHGCKAAAGETCEHFCRAPNCEMTEATNEFGVAILSCGPS